VAELGVEQVLKLVLAHLEPTEALVAEEKTGAERLPVKELLVKEIMPAHLLVELITVAVAVVLDLLALFAMVVLGHLAQLMVQQQLVLAVVAHVFMGQTLAVAPADRVEAVTVALEHTIKVGELKHNPVQIRLVLVLVAQLHLVM
jgi:hypothetical protein